MKKLFLLLLAGLLVCGFCACASTTEIIAGDLKVELTRIERTGDGAVHMTWRVDNPNIVAYVLAKTSHKLTLNGTLAGTFTDDSHLGVPPQSQMERTGTLIPASPSVKALIDQAMSQGSAAYQMESVVMLLIFDDKFEKIRLTAKGTVPVVAK